MNVINKTTSVAVLIALGLALGAMAANAAESPSAPNYGAADFKPTPQQPLGFQADGNGWYPGATAPFAGVLGEYYATHECSDLLWTRLDDRVGFTDWEGLRETGRRERAFSARWTGLLHVSTSGVHVLEHRSDGLLTVSINGKPVLRYQKANPAGDATEVALERGEYPVEIEYRHVGSEARLQLSWRPPQGKSRPLAGGDLLLRLSPGMPPQIAEMFDLDQPVQRHRVPGLRGQYFRGVDHRAFRGAGVGGDLIYQQRDRYLSMRGTYPVAARDMSVRWTGVFVAQRSGAYSFDLSRVCHAARIWVDGRELAQAQGMARAELVEGLHPLRIEHVYVQDKGWIDVTWTGPGQNAPAVLGGRHVWTRPWDDMRDPPIMVVYAFYGHSQVDGGAAGTLEHGNRVWLLDDKENLWRRAGENGSGPIEPFLDALAARHPGVWFGGLKMVQYGSDLSKNMSKGTRAYQSLIERIRLALGHPATRLGGVACIIGYGDLDRKPSEKQFAEEYIALIDSMRRDLAEPDLPFVVSQIEPVRGGKRDLGWQPIHSAIASLPGLRKHVAVAPANDLFRDAIHYTGPGYRRWGNEAAAEVLKQSLLDPVLARSRGEDGERLAGRVGVSPPPNQVLAVVEARLV